VEEQPIGRGEYIRRVLGAYHQTPGTAGTIRRPDRLLAAERYSRGVPLCSVENAFVLAASPRLIRPAGAPPLPTIRSLACFSPVIEEVLESSVNPEYYQYLRYKIQRFVETTNLLTPDPARLTRRWPPWTRCRSKETSFLPPKTRPTGASAADQGVRPTPHGKCHWPRLVAPRAGQRPTPRDSSRYAKTCRSLPNRLRRGSSGECLYSLCCSRY
jgi:hypothetical protein